MQLLTVIVPADEAATLFERQPCGDRPGSPFCACCDPTHPFVVHTANIDPAICETCDGKGVKTDPDSVGRAFAAVLNEGKGAGVKHLRCPTCNGEGTVPAVVTLAVKCETYGITHIGSLKGGTGRCKHEPPCERGFRPVGTATVAHCWPIVASIPDLPTYPAGQVAELSSSGTLWLGTAREGQWSLSEVMADITGQVVGTPTPNLYLLELINVEAT